LKERRVYINKQRRDAYKR